MSSSFDLVTIDSPQTDELASFWCAVLDLRVTQREDGDRWIVLSDVAGARRIGLQRGAHTTGGTHLDLACVPDDFAGEIARLLALGAVLVAPLRHEPYGSIANLADPDGNLFDLCAYRS